MLRLISRLAVAAALAATAYVALPAAPAAAAACPTADGVTVVVDFHELEGGVRSVCVPDGGGEAASRLFPQAGFPLTYVRSQPGFVCRVSGKPADNPCMSTPPADAYWGLWWSDGRSGRWSYSSTSAGGLEVPDGGYVAFSWNGRSGSVPPGTSPTPRPDPTPTQQPSSAQPTKQPSTPSTPQQSSAAPSGTASGSASRSASPSDQPSEDARKKPRKPRTATASVRATSSEAASDATETEDTVVPASADPPDAGGAGLPAWVAPVVVVLLFGAAGGVAAARRRRGGAS
ncbi:hypothetical protein [Nocardioides pyridinolyticus]